MSPFEDLQLLVAVVDEVLWFLGYVAVAVLVLKVINRRNAARREALSDFPAPSNSESGNGTGMDINGIGSPD